MLGIPGFHPKFFDDAQKFKQQHQDTLSNILGYPIQSYYVQWETDDDCWNADAPIILIIKAQQYEFCAFKGNEFHLSVNQIDRSLPLDWYGSNDEFPLIWKKNPFEEVNRLLDKKIEAIQIVEWQGLLVGLQFFLATNPLPLCLLNALDENGIYIDQLPKEERRL